MKERKTYVFTTTGEIEEFARVLKGRKGFVYIEVTENHKNTDAPHDCFNMFYTGNPDVEGNGQFSSMVFKFNKYIEVRK